MSHAASLWAVRQTDNLNPGAKLLLMVLADAANEYGVGYTGRRRQAELCCCRPATITEHTKRLVDAGLVAFVERHRPNGSRTTRYYVLAPNQESRGEMLNAPVDEYSEELAALARSGTESAPTEGVRYGNRTRSGTDSLPTRTSDTSLESIDSRGGLGGDQPSLDTALEARVEAFLDVHAARVEARGAAKPPRTAPAREAARSILRREPDSREILARLDWALGHPYWSDKVLTLPSFRRYWDRLTVQWKAAVARDAALGNGNGNGHNRPQEPTFRRVDYSGERVRIIRDDD